MISRKIDIWQDFKYQGRDKNFRPFLNTYILAGGKKRGAVLVCPGGGYATTSPREGEAVVLQFNAAGLHAFVLHYSVAPNRHPQPLLDLARAMTIIGQNKEEWMIKKNKIAVCGFSAGGHLVASLGVHWDKQFLEKVKGIKKENNRPNALILAYPVISSGEFVHRGSFSNLLGNNPTKELFEVMSLEKQVNEKTPPAFIWHTFNDQGVPVENSLLFAQNLRAKGIPFELHIYQDGPHGLSLATEEADNDNIGVNFHVATWLNLCIQWLKEILIF